MKYQILDLDGCLSDDRHRRHLILDGDPRNNSHFAAYHDGCHLDLPVNLHEVLIDGTRNIILTSRPLAVYEKTKDWLLEVAGIYPHILLMRNNNDHRRSLVLKEEMMGWLWDPNLMYGIDPQNIISAIDDQESIVQMYREKFKIPARVVRIGDEHVLG
jgi:hypothetical protein